MDETEQGSTAEEIGLSIIAEQRTSSSWDKPVEGLKSAPWSECLEKKREKKSDVFEAFLSKEGSRARKECVHKHVIRSLRKRCIKTLSRPPSPSPIASLVLGTPGFFTQFIAATKLPATERRSSRRKWNKWPEHRSLNAEFLRELFRKDKARELLALYVEEMWERPEHLCTKMKLACCRGEHSEACSASWDSLRHYLTHTMLTDLGLAPFDAASEMINKPPSKKRR